MNSGKVLLEAQGLRVAAGPRTLIESLDLHHQVTVLNHLRRLTRERGRAIVMSIHDLNLAAPVRRAATRPAACP